MIAAVTTAEPFTLVLAIATGVLAIARVTRLVVDDDFPPVEWLREKYVSHTSDRWGVLVDCPWCVAPYLALPDLLWAWSSGLAWWWWLPNAWAAVSWAAAFLCMRDLPPEQRG